MWCLKIDMALWVLLGVVWLGAAPFSRKTVRRESIGSRLRYLVPVLVAAGLIVGAERLGVPWLDDRFIPATPLWGALSVGLTALGVAFALWARRTLGRNWSGTVTLKEGHELVRTGPYALVRNPIYTGFLVAGLGTALCLGTVRVFLGLFVIAASFIIKMRTEERFMRGRFGEAYEDYRKKVRALIPYLW